MPSLTLLPRHVESLTSTDRRDMKAHIFSLLFVLVIALSGCAGATASWEELAAADFGPVPTRHEDAIKELVSRSFKDPYSAVYRFGPPRKAFGQTGWAVGGQKYFGYVIPVSINAKNSYGAYTGEKL